MASFHVNNVKRMRAYLEANGALGTDHTGTLTDFFDLPFIEGSAELTLEEDSKDPAYARQYRDDHNLEILGVKKAKLKFSINLGPQTARAGSGVTAAETPAGQLLGLVMGGTNLGTGDTVNTANATTTAITVATAARWKPGGCMGWGDANGVMHMREIASVSGDVVTLKQALPSAPLNSDPLYNCASYYLDNNDSDSNKTLQILLQGLGNAGDGWHDVWLLMGGQMTEAFAPEIKSGEIPKITFSFSFADWEHGDEATMTAGSLALSVATYANTNAILVADGSFRVPTVGVSTLTGSEIYASDFKFEPKFKYVPITSPGGVNNVAAYVMDGEHPKIEGSFQLPYQDQTWFDCKQNSTVKAAFLQIGSSETYGAILISVPTIQITDFQRVDANGIMSQEVKFKGRLDEATTMATTTYLGLSPFRIHIA